MLKVRKFLFKKNLISSQRNMFFYSNPEEVQLQRLQEKAYIATVLIDNIIKPRGINDIAMQSLSTKLINLIQKDKLIKDQIARKEMLAFFKEGIPIDQSIFNNQKHIAAKNNYAQTNSDSNKFFTFFPTSIVTGQIFRNILNSNMMCSLWTGHFGSSKSISLRLYCEYRLKERFHNIQISKLVKNYPKLFYWTIDIKADKSFRTVKKKLFNQCKDVEKDERKRLKFMKSLNDKNQKIFSFYNKHNLSTILVIDQLDQYANIVRDSLKNNQLEVDIFSYQQKQRALGYQNLLLQQQKKLSIYRKNQNQRKKTQKNKAKLQKMLEQIVYQFGQIIYFSSFDIQSQILKQIKTSRDKHIPLILQRIAYSQLLEEDKTLYEIVDYFEFQMINKTKQFHKLSNYSFYQKCKQSIRNQLFQHLKQKSRQLSITPLSIAAYLQANKDILRDDNNINQIFKMQDQNQPQKMKYYQIQKPLLNQAKVKLYQMNLIKSLKQILNKIVTGSLNILTYNFSNFIKKLENQDKYKLISEILSNDFKQFESQNPLQKYKINLTVIEDGINKFQSDITKHLFYMDSMGNTYSLFPKKVVLKVIKQYKNNTIKYIFDTMSANLVKQAYDDKDKSKKGKYFQKLFIQAVSSGAVKFKFLSAPNLYFYILDGMKYGFQAIPNQNQQRHKTYSFLQSFKQTFKNINFINQQNCTTFFVPIKKQISSPQSIKKIVNKQIQIFYDKDMSLNNPCFDFTISNIDFRKQEITLYCFDLTICKNAEDKLFRAILRMIKLKNMQDNNKVQNKIKLKNNILYKVQLQCFVISPCKFNEQWKTSLKTKLQKEGIIIQFDRNDNDRNSILKIKTINGNANHIIKQVGLLYMGESDMQLQDSENPNKYYSLYGKLTDIVQKQTSNIKISSQNVKSTQER